MSGYGKFTLLSHLEEENNMSINFIIGEPASGKSAYGADLIIKYLELNKSVLTNIYLDDFDSLTSYEYDENLSLIGSGQAFQPAKFFTQLTSNRTEKGESELPDLLIFDEFMHNKNHADPKFVESLMYLASKSCDVYLIQQSTFLTSHSKSLFKNKYVRVINVDFIIRK